MTSVANRLRYCLRKLGHAPMFASVAIITLAVGIGANTAIFSVVKGVLLDPLPFHEPEKLVGVWHEAPGLGQDQLNQGPAFHLTYQAENRVFEEIGMWNRGPVSVTGLAEPEKVEALIVTESVLSALRVQPLLGRPFSAEDDSHGSPKTVILSYAYWQRRFGGESEVIGRKLIVEGQPRDIIGVMPQSFRFMSTHPSLLIPFQLNPSEVFVGNFSHQAVARLRPGVTLEQANADVARMMPLAIENFPLPPGFTLDMVEEARLGPNLRPLKQDAVGDIGKVLWVLLGTVGMVLLIACANVANLFLVRVEGRQRELAIRAAVGADWRQIAKELLFESVTLGIIGGVLGLILAYSGIRLLVAMAPEYIPRLEEISIDPAVLLFAAGVSVFAGMLFGLISVFKYAKPGLVSSLKEGGRSISEGKERHRVRNALVVSQIALAMVLLVGSGLMIRTFQALRSVDPGFVRADQVLTLRVSIPEADMPDAERAVRTHEQIMRRIKQIPGVGSVGLATSITMDGQGSNDGVFVENPPESDDRIPAMRRHKWISSDYFETMGIPILAGRDITWTDVYNRARVAIITENLAREYWKDPANAIGRRIRETPKSPWREIVGVVGNVHDDGVSREATFGVYWPMLMENFWGRELFAQRTMAYAIRSERSGNPGFLREVQQAVWSVSPNLPLANVRLLQTILEESTAQTSFTLVMLGIAAGVALLLGVVGVYGVISDSVSHRQREIGIRIALGARPGQVVGIFVRNGLVLTFIGVALGLGAATGLTRFLSNLLFGVSPMDPVTFTLVPVALGSAALLASFVPALRASTLDPAETLRSE